MDDSQGQTATQPQPGPGGETPIAAAAHPGSANAGAQPNEEELRAAYEAELSRITSSDMILQTTVSLINIGGRRLGLTAPGTAPAESERTPPGTGDLDQVRDAIDGARALMPILERHMPAELGPMRDAIAQLQMAYAREVQAASSASPAAPQAPSPPQAPSAAPPEPPAPSGSESSEKAPGPAQASGRLWVPGR